MLKDRAYGLSGTLTCTQIPVCYENCPVGWPCPCFELPKTRLSPVKGGQSQLKTTREKERKRWLVSDRLTYQLPESQTGCLTSWLVDWSIDCLAACQLFSQITDRLANSFIDLPSSWLLIFCPRPSVDKSTKKANCLTQIEWTKRANSKRQRRLRDHFFLPHLTSLGVCRWPFSTWWGVVVGTVWKSRVKLDFVIVSDTTSSSGYLNMWPL